ncbi:DNA cytosine methyltransferase [Anaerosinus massiliensis]|uniref:DNA cytosine methyltransferase n=1 Tax=Massilibacillus massiliensis TaxID=1806837 RepID=UPI000AE7E52B|nr:DNA cytosine methyltransferase [Massilibacillus massiliensis]
MYKVVDLFAGAGGLSYGFAQTKKFKIVVAAENNINAQATYKLNHEDVRMFSDVAEVKASSIAEFGDIDVVIGGPPCQGFSNANRQKNTAVSMNNRLVKEFVRVITELKPQVFVMENVSMLKSSVHRFYLEEGDETLECKEIDMMPDKIELLPADITLEILKNAKDNQELGAIIKNDQFKTQFQWSTKKYLLFNSIYKVAAQKTDKEEEKNTQHNKLVERIKKHKKKLLFECNQITRNGKPSNQILQFDYNCAIFFENVLNGMESISVDALRLVLKPSIIVQRMISKWQELISRKIIIDSYDKSHGFVANVRSYAVLDYIKGILGSEPYNYSITSDTLNAAEFGVPQKRMRYVIIGCESGLASRLDMPKGIFKEDEFRTVKDAIEDILEEIPSVDVNVAPIHIQKMDLPADSLGYRLRNSGLLYNHVNTDTRETAKKRFKKLAEGENFHDLPKELKNTYTNGERTQNTIYLKLEYDKPCGTVVNVRKSMWIHPKHSRALSIREAARLQTFPDKFVFKGTKDSQYQQVGNAVPPILGEAIAEKVLEILDSHDDE